MPSSQASPNRVSSLDHLRGLSAFGIMMFHYGMWTYGHYKAQDFLGRVGIYGVSIFYVLSGLTLYHVYFQKIGGPSSAGLKDFFVKRAFRIFPLFWLATLGTIIVEHEGYSTQKLLLTFSGLFSVYQWNDTICYGAWSIGNELTFYLFFPVFVYLLKRSLGAFIALATAILGIFLWFAFKGIPDHGATDFFTVYTNPLDQTLLFLSGFMIGHFSKYLRLPRLLGPVLIIVCILAFTFIPASGDNILLISGFNRIYFTIICIVLCVVFYKAPIGLPRVLNHGLSVLGEISYSVYLIHPLVWNLLSQYVTKYHPQTNVVSKIGIGYLLTLLVAKAIYTFVEVKFMALGRRVLKKAK